MEWKSAQGNHSIHTSSVSGDWTWALFWRSKTWKRRCKYFPSTKEVKIVVECVLEGGTGKVEPHGDNGGGDEECHSLCHVLGTHELLWTHWILRTILLGHYYYHLHFTEEKSEERGSIPKLHNGRWLTSFNFLHPSEGPNENENQMADKMRGKKKTLGNHGSTFSSC